jgi:hypothetical protein
MAQYPRVLSLYVVVSLSVFQFDLREIGAATFPEDINKGKLDSVSICKQVICFLFEHAMYTLIQNAIVYSFVIYISMTERSLSV